MAKNSKLTKYRFHRLGKKAFSFWPVEKKGILSMDDFQD